MVSQQRLDNIWRLLAVRRVRGWAVGAHEGFEVLIRMDPHAAWVRRLEERGPWTRLPDGADRAGNRNPPKA